MAIREYQIETGDVNPRAVMDAIQDNYPQFWIDVVIPGIGDAKRSDVRVEYDGATLLIGVDDSVTDAELDALVVANPASIESISEANHDNKVALLVRVRERVLAELDKDTPDWDLLYNEALVFVTARPTVLKQVNNMADLDAISMGSILSALPLARQKAIRLNALIKLVALHNE